ncbi:hypothetical protein [Leptospira sarikeiensis]|uniref:Uncharacterized protein n=1 Tax=Leptospira sarikeiensis TaxID=2484943 RepID=A0A4R9K0V0_9LEPT|nr:hypothetical protein [Leptospira sarikeiensis]TGL57578.1 hypothetical protein EHQ64_19465 [Leptospira sarikeiensis]
MRFLHLLLFLLLADPIFGKGQSIPAEIWLKPWWVGGEVSVFGIFGSEEKSRAGVSFQIPIRIEPKEEYRLQYIRTARDSQREFFEILSLGYKVSLNSDFGFQAQLGGETSGYTSYFGALGFYTSKTSWDLFGRKNQEENSFGILVRSLPNDQYRISLGYERIRSDLFDPEDKFSIGVYWSWEKLLGQIQILEGEGSPIGTAGLGVSPFIRSETKVEDTPTTIQRPKPKEIFPILKEEEILRLGFSLQEAFLISSLSKGESEKFREYIEGLSEPKRKKLRGLIYSKRSLK